jgi:hypothetical protein
MQNDDSLMTEEEKNLRNNINMELEQRGFHLRVSTLHAKTDEVVFDFLQPVSEWIEEFSTVDSLVTMKIKEWQQIREN